ncbi:MAG TPA: ATP-binding protein [Gemmatimonadaceae bacterium]|nr:ATP-binding protein [Gemmatimonadaceae bacterium]
MRTWPSSLRARLTLWYTALLALPLIAFALISYAFFARALLQRTDRFIGDALTAFSRELTAERRLAGTVDEAARTTVDEVRFRELHIVVIDSAWTVVAATDDHDTEDLRVDLGRVTAAIRERPAIDGAAVTLLDRATPFRLVTRPLALQGRRVVLAGVYPLLGNRELLGRIRELFALAIPVLIVGAATGGSLLARRNLAPMTAMTARAAEISATNLHERLPVAGADELAALALVVNGLLNRLENSFEYQRQFMADASHELRTPTAIVRTETDVTLSREHRTEEEYRASVTIMRDAARRLTRIVDDLFLLTRADAGQVPLRKSTIYLEEVVHDAARAVAPIAEQHDISVVLGTMVEAPYEGDADLLGRVLLNLLDNSLKHAPPRSTVVIDLARETGAFTIAVTDAGPGIAPDAQGQVFERFYRADPAPSNGDGDADSSGAGLGLAIARRLTELHGGRLDLAESQPGRTVFRVILPAAGN